MLGKVCTCRVVPKDVELYTEICVLRLPLHCSTLYVKSGLASKKIILTSAFKISTLHLPLLASSTIKYFLHSSKSVYTLFSVLADQSRSAVGMVLIVGKCWDSKGSV